MTSRTLYSCTMSLDGFLAGPGGDMQWLNRHVGPNPVAERLVSQVGSLLVGGVPTAATTPTAAPTARAPSADSGTGRRSCSPTRHPTRRCPTRRFVTDLETGVAAAREAAGDRYVNVLGADVARQCLAAGLLDEVLVLVVPELLGDGTRLFDWPGGHSVDLRLREFSEAGGTANLWYDVVR